MSAGRDLRNRFEARLRSHVTNNEPVLAVGTAEEFPSAAADFSGQGSFRFLLVTAQRLLFGDWSRPEQPYEDIVFDDVTRWSDGTQYHRYVVSLQHGPLTRDEWAPAHTILWFRWGGSTRPRTRTSTTLRFSHREAKAARALRKALSERGRPHETLLLPEVAREQRLRGSQAELRRTTGFLHKPR